jgi:hypothetical protein
MMPNSFLRSLAGRVLALVVAYALAFGPALAGMAHGKMAALPMAAGEMCLTSANGSGPTPASSHDGAAHADCCLSGCRLAPLSGADTAGAVSLPERIAVHAALPAACPRGAAPAASCLPPPATGPPIRA